MIIANVASCKLTHKKYMYCTKKNELKIKFKDNKIIVSKKSFHNSYCADNNCETFFQSLNSMRTRA